MLRWKAWRWSGEEDEKKRGRADGRDETGQDV
jgi:hypothetical protein